MHLQKLCEHHKEPILSPSLVATLQISLIFSTVKQCHSWDIIPIQKVKGNCNAIKQTCTKHNILGLIVSRPILWRQTLGVSSTCIIPRNTSGTLLMEWNSGHNWGVAVGCEWHGRMLCMAVRQKTGAWIGGDGDLTVGLDSGTVRSHGSWSVVRTLPRHQWLPTLLYWAAGARMGPGLIDANIRSASWWPEASSSLGLPAESSPAVWSWACLPKPSVTLQQFWLVQISQFNRLHCSAAESAIIRLSVALLLVGLFPPLVSSLPRYDAWPLCGRLLTYCCAHQVLMMVVEAIFFGFLLRRT